MRKSTWFPSSLEGCSSSLFSPTQQQHKEIHSTKGRESPQLGCLPCFCLWLSSRCQLSSNSAADRPGPQPNGQGHGHLQKAGSEGWEVEMAQKGCEEQRGGGRSTRTGCPSWKRALRRAWRMSVGGAVVLTWVRFSCGNQYRCVDGAFRRISAVKKRLLQLTFLSEPQGPARHKVT